MGSLRALRKAQCRDNLSAGAAASESEYGAEPASYDGMVRVPDGYKYPSLLYRIYLIPVNISPLL